ncbi:MAG TPA: tetratricopeptide repeat protein [Phycisphaerae bacterium]|nr:tetratricopeptide repeat protein [Phycisphaerae bacterium]
MNLGATATVGARGRLLPFLPVLLLTVVAFLPSLRGEFVDWDDNTLFLENGNYRGLGLANIRWMFTHATLGHYQPIAWLTLGADYCVWGMNPVGYHVTSLLFHLANTALVYALALVMLRRTARGPAPRSAALSWAAAACAALFAVHPLRAESVAWITERGSLVSTFFLLACVLYYVRYTEHLKHRRRWYLLSLALFFLSLLSKAWAITLPFVLLLIDVYPLRRWPTRDWPAINRVSRLLLEKLPFVLIAIVTAGLAYYAKSRAGMVSLHHHGWPERFAQAAFGLCFYPFKTLWPAGLSPIYELPIPFEASARQFIFSGVVVALAALTLAAVRRRVPGLFVAMLAFGILVSPALGLAQTGPQLVADRYSYISCIPFALLAGGALLMAARRGRYSRSAAAMATVAVVIVLATSTWTQTQIWRSSTALWARALEIDPRSPTANSNMGAQFVKAGRFAEAIECFRVGLAKQPDSIGMLNLAYACAQVGQSNESRQLLRQALEKDPRSVRTLLSAARIRASMSDHVDAVDLYRRALTIEPNEATTHYALGTVLIQLGRPIEAAASLERTIALLEPHVQAGVGDESRRLYLDACGRLEAHFTSRDDLTRARDYQQRIQSLARRE